MATSPYSVIHHVPPHFYWGIATWVKGFLTTVPAAAGEQKTSINQSNRWQRWTRLWTKNGETFLFLDIHQQWAEIWSDTGCSLCTQWNTSLFITKVWAGKIVASGKKAKVHHDTPSSPYVDFLYATPPSLCLSFSLTPLLSPFVLFCTFSLTCTDLT